MPKREPTSSTPATTALTVAGVPFTVRAYDHDPALAEHSSYGEEAAAALGVVPARVFKTLLALVDPSTGSGGPDQLVVAVVPVTGQLDLKSLAQAVAGKRARMADPAVAERVTGYVVGGISPVGQKRRLPTVLDSSAFGHRTVLVSGGRRGLDLELSPDDLAAVTDAAVAPIGRLSPS